MEPLDEVEPAIYLDIDSIGYDSDDSDDDDDDDDGDDGDGGGDDDKDDLILDLLPLHYLY